MTTDNNAVGLALIPSRRYIILGTPGFVPMASPGVCVIKSAGRPLKYDEQEGYGMDGGYLNFHGQKFVHFEVEIRIWEAAHWLQWELFEMMLEPPASILEAPNVTLGIDHPILKNVGIEKAYCTDCGFWEPLGETGLWTRTISFTKWVKPRTIATKTLEGPPAIGVAVVPLTAQQKINAELDAENAALRAKP